MKSIDLIMYTFLYGFARICLLLTDHRLSQAPSLMIRPHQDWIWEGWLDWGSNPVISVDNNEVREWEEEAVKWEGEWKGKVGLTKQSWTRAWYVHVWWRGVAKSISRSRMTNNGRLKLYVVKSHDNHMIVTWPIAQKTLHIWQTVLNNAHMTFVIRLCTIITVP